MRTVVFGIIGSVLDKGYNEKRHLRWRPTVDIARHPELKIARMELLHDLALDEVPEIVANDIRRHDPGIDVRLHPVTWRDPWDLEEVYARLHDFARGFAFDTTRERYLVHVTTGTHVAQISLFLLTEAGYFPAQLLQTSPPAHAAESGGGNGWKQTPGQYSIIDLDLSKYDRLAARFERERNDARTLLKAGIETRSPVFNRMIERIEQVALASKAPMLLLGPTGAGKSWLAKRIHALKRGRNQVAGELVEINCATLRGDTAMSTLFGHARGAFTGASEPRAGLLRKADGGVLFLDEIGELGPDEQAMLLRALEEKSFFPVGSDKEVKSDFQLIAGTNRDLRIEARRGRFRPDLLARIDLWAFTLPGLAQRPEDIEPNLDFELERLSTQLRHKVSMNEPARARFLAFAMGPQGAWLGNFRDFSAALTRMGTLATGGRITPVEVDEEIARLLECWRDDDASQDAPDQGDGLLRRVLGEGPLAGLDRFDRVQLAEVLRVCSTARSLSEAGRALFDRSRERKTSVNDADRLKKYLARFELTLDVVVSRARGA